MYCTNCGAKISDESRFCPACGAPQHHVAGAAPAAAPAPAPSAAVPPAPRPHRSRKTPLIVGAALAVVIVAGVLVWKLALAPFDIDEKAFPDTVVRNLVVTQLDTNHDGKLGRDEANAVTSLTIDNASSVSGLGTYFKNLATLKLSGSATTSVDTSDLGKLLDLDISGTSIPVLDTSHNDALERLVISNTPISQIDVTDNKNLQAIDTRGSQVKDIDVSQNTKLGEVGVDPDTQLHGIDQTDLRAVSLVTQIEETTTSTSGSFVSYRWSAAYNPDGTIASQTGEFVSPDSSSSFRKSCTYTYDDQGRVVSSTKQSLLGGLAEGDCTYAYDDQGRVTTITSANQTTSYAYDDQGRLQSTTMTGEMNSTETYTYDDQGRVTQVKRSGAASKSLDSDSSYTIYTYDDAGRVASVTQDSGYADNRPVYTMTYDDRGNVVSSSVTGIPLSPGVKSGPTTYTYDDQNRITKMAGADSTGFLFSYDEEGRLSEVTSTLGSMNGMTWKLTYGATTYVRKDAKDPAQAFTVAPAYAVSPYDPDLGVFQTMPDEPVSPEPFSMDNYVMHQ